MLIENLPRLPDEERELADDEYAVMPAAVPANLSFDDLIAQRTAALDAMRMAGDDFAAFSRASRQEAELAAQIRRVRRQAIVTNPPPADLPSPDFGKSYMNPKRLVLGYLSRLRQRHQQRRLARAQGWLEACQCANENHPGLYDALAREAELTVAKLKEGQPTAKITRSRSGPDRPPCGAPLFLLPKSFPAVLRRTRRLRSEGGES